MKASIKEWFQDGTKRDILFLILGGCSLIISFFDIGHLPVNAAWVAILLCGIPIIKDAVVGLVTRFDIKADVLVSLALIASVIIGNFRCGRSRVHYADRLPFGGTHRRQGARRY